MKKISIIIFIALSSFIAGAQEITLHNMEFLGQRNTLNPALNPITRFYITGLDVGLGFQNNFSINDIREFEPNSDSFYFSPTKIIEGMKKNNALRFDQLINFGFGVRLNPKFFLHASAVEKFNFRTNYPEDLFSFMFKGNLHEDNVNKAMDIGGFKFNGTAYLEYSLGASYQVNCNLGVGARLKYLTGIANISTKQSNMEITTSNEIYQWKIENDLDFRYSIPESIRANANGKINPLDFLALRNNGIGIDLGGTFLTLNNKLLLTASIIDLGYINWFENSRKISNQSENRTFIFNGFDKNTISASDNGVQNLLDTISSTFNLVDEEISGYRTNLIPKMYISGSYDIYKGTRVGGMMYGEIANNKFTTAWSVNGQTRISKIVNLQGNISLINKKISNIGLGAAVNLGPIQIFALTNNANILFFDPFDVRTLHFRFGLNLVWAYGKDKKNPCSPDYVTPGERNRMKEETKGKKKKQSSRIETAPTE